MVLFFYPWRLLFAIYIDISILFVLHTVYHFNQSGNASEKRFLDHRETLRPYSERLWHSMTKRCSFFEASQRSEAAEHTDGSGKNTQRGLVEKLIQAFLILHLAASQVSRFLKAKPHFFPR